MQRKVIEAVAFWVRNGSQAVIYSAPETYRSRGARAVELNGDCLEGPQCPFWA